LEHLHVDSIVEGIEVYRISRDKSVARVAYGFVPADKQQSATEGENMPIARCRARTGISTIYSSLALHPFAVPVLAGSLGRRTGRR